MKKILAIASFIAATTMLHAQQLDGTYKQGNDSLSFSNAKAIFNIGGFGGLSVNKMGEGSFEWIDDFLLIHTADYSGEKTTVQALDGSKKDTVVIKITDNENFPVQGALIEELNDSGKSLNGSASDDNGKTFHKKSPKVRAIKVSMMGYDEVTFDYNPAKDYLIRLAKGDVVEHQTVVFRVKETDEETISLLLITSDFKDEKDKQKALAKLAKKAEKQNILDKWLKKVYVPLYMK